MVASATFVPGFPVSTASTEAEVAATAASIQRPLSQVAAGVGGSPEADVGRSSGRLDGSKATSETTDAQEPGIVGSAAASNGISGEKACIVPRASRKKIRT
jgi:hypothetical protein